MAEETKDRARNDVTDELNAHDALGWQLLRNAMLRALVKGNPARLTAEEAQNLLEPFTAQLMADCQVLREAFKRAYLLGVERVHRELHGAPGVDHEMLEQAIEYHSHPQDSDGEALAP